MAHEHDLAATLARVEALEREVGLAHARHAQLIAARQAVNSLREENASLPAYSLPAGELLRLIFGLALLFVGSFDVVAWDSRLAAAPPFFAGASPCFALAAAVAGVLVIGIRGPHRLVALLAPLPLAVLLAVRGWLTPEVFDHRDGAWILDISPRVYATYVVPGHMLVILVVILAIVSRRRPG